MASKAPIACVSGNLRLCDACIFAVQFMCEQETNKQALGIG